MKEKNIKEKTQQKKKMGLTTKIFVALIAGAILGIILCYLVPGIYPSDENAGCTVGILFPCLRKYVHR